MRKISKILFPISILFLIASGVLFILSDLSLAQQTKDMGLCIKDFFGKKDVVNICLFSALIVCFIILAIFKAINRRKEKQTHGINFFITVFFEALFLMIFRDFIVDLVKTKDTLSLISVILYVIHLILIILLGFIADKKTEKSICTYRKHSPGIYLFTALLIVAFLVVVFMVKGGVEFVGTLVNDTIKFVFDFDKTWNGKDVRNVLLLTVLFVSFVGILISTIRRKRNIVSPLYLIFTVLLGLVLASNYNHLVETIKSYLNGSSELLYIVFIVVSVFVMAYGVVVIVQFIEALAQLFDNDETPKVTYINKEESSKVKSLIAEIEDEEDNDDPDAYDDEDEEEEEDDEDEEVVSRKTLVLSNEDEEEEDEEEDEEEIETSQEDEYDEFADDEDDDLEEEDDDEDDFYDDDEDDEDEEEEDDDSDARELLQRRREEIRRRILAARANATDDEDEDEEEIVEEDVEDDEIYEEEIVEEDVEDDEIYEEEIIEEDVEDDDEIYEDDDEYEYDEEDEDDSSDAYEESVMYDDEIEEDEEEDDDEEEEYDEEDDENDEESLTSRREYIRQRALLRNSEEDNEDEEKPKFTAIKSKPLSDKLVTVLDEDKKERYNVIRNELQSYKQVRERLSSKGDSYRFHGSLIAKMTVSGKTLRLHLALNPIDFEGSKYNYQDLSSKSKFVYVPMTIKLTSKRSVKYALELIEMLAQTFNLVKNPKYKEQDYMGQLEVDYATKLEE